MLKAVILMAVITLAATALGLAARRIMRGRGRAVRNLVIVIIALAGFTGINFVGGYVLAPSLFLKDYPDMEAHSYVTGIDTAEKIDIDGTYGKLSGWKYGDETSSLVIYYGGNKECSALRMKYLSDNAACRGCFAGCDFVCVDYPGYCDSEGTAGAKSFRQYGLDVYDSLTASGGSDKVYIMGYSIGTGVANYVASQRECDGLILLAPYSDGSDLYNTIANIFHGPLKVLVGFDMKSSEYAADIKVKPLIIAAQEDEVIPWDCAQRLSECYPNGTDFVLIEGIGHSDIWGNEDAAEKIEKYLHG